MKIPYLIVDSFHLQRTHAMRPATLLSSVARYTHWITRLVLLQAVRTKARLIPMPTAWCLSKGVLIFKTLSHEYAFDEPDPR